MGVPLQGRCGADHDEDAGASSLHVGVCSGPAPAPFALHRLGSGPPLSWTGSGDHLGFGEAASLR